MNDTSHIFLLMRGKAFYKLDIFLLMKWKTFYRLEIYDSLLKLVILELTLELS